MESRAEVETLVITIGSNRILREVRKSNDVGDYLTRKHHRCCCVTQDAVRGHWDFTTGLSGTTT